MELNDNNNNQYELLAAILPIVLEKGPSRTTMDLVASTLGISKRTLYEIFENKDEMLRAVIHHMHEGLRMNIERILDETPNMMEGMLAITRLHREWLRHVSPEFFLDMDERVKSLRHTFDSRNEERNNHVMSVIEKGISQGMFRDNCDYAISFRLLRVQLESIKRMEDNFPSEITIDQAFNAIADGFLRSIATPRGIEVLESLQNKKTERTS